MASESSSQERIELVIPADDLILPFQADQADVVGRLVKLGPVVDTILSRHDYLEPVSQLLGEAVALTALLGAALKFEGKFILQASTDGPVDLLVAEIEQRDVEYAVGHVDAALRHAGAGHAERFFEELGGLRRRLPGARAAPRLCALLCRSRRCARQW